MSSNKEFVWIILNQKIILKGNKLRMILLKFFFQPVRPDTIFNSGISFKIYTRINIYNIKFIRYFLIPF